MGRMVVVEVVAISPGNEEPAMALVAGERRHGLPPRTATTKRTAQQADAYQRQGTNFMAEKFDKTFWEERYRGHAATSGMAPNAQLVAEAGDLPPGTALDAGCGEGADARWLAERGWRVTAVDIAANALRRAQQHTEPLGADLTGRIDWVAADLTHWTPPEDHFDLVSTQYVHPAAGRAALFRRLAAAVAPGGTLLVVGHHPSDPHTTGSHAPVPEVHFTAEEVAADLDPDRWDIVVAEARTRTVDGRDGHGADGGDGGDGDHGGHEGHEGHASHEGHGGRGVAMCDAVLRARKRW